VVLMDEPLGALDKRLRETMQYEIMRLHRDLSLTIVYVTHDQNEALTMSDRVAVFSDGRIQQAATPTELYENAANAFVANFVGENNGLTGRVMSNDADWAALQLADGSVVQGRAGSGLGISDTAMLALRPERAHIAATPESVAQAAQQNMNVVHGLVQELVYCGDHHRIHLKLGAGETVVVKVPNTQHQDLPALGRQTAVVWRRDDCKVLPTTAAARVAASPDDASHAAPSSSSSASPLIAGVN
jgi:putative spermidine/putrescine transport system ATP-binding protein